METLEKVEVTSEMPLEKIIQNGQHPYLKPKLLKIRPISNLKFEGQTLTDLPQGFTMAEYLPLDLPIDRKTGQLIKVLDDKKKNYCPEYKEELTEVEFFSREIGTDVSTSKTENNFWKAFTDLKTGESRHSFTVNIPMKGNGMILDLSKPLDVLKSKIIYNNTKVVAPSWDERFHRGTYKVAILDENKQIDTKKELLDKITEALVIYSTEYKGQESKLRNFIVVHDPMKKYNKNTSLATLETYVGELAKENPDAFFNVHNDQFFITKVKLAKAIDVGYIKHVTKTTYATINDEPLGTQSDIILKMNEDINFLNRIEKEIQDK